MPDPSGPSRSRTGTGRTRTRTPTRTLALVGVVLLSLYVLFAPTAGGGPGFTGADKAVHLALFALLALTAARRLGARRGVWATVASYAVVSELVQAIALPRRSGDLLDVVADLLGVALGWLVARRLP